MQAARFSTSFFRMHRRTWSISSRPLAQSIPLSYSRRAVDLPGQPRSLASASSARLHSLWCGGQRPRGCSLTLPWGWQDRFHPYPSVCLKPNSPITVLTCRDRFGRLAGLSHHRGSSSPPAGREIGRTLSALLRRWVGQTFLCSVSFPRDSVSPS